MIYTILSSTVITLVMVLNGYSFFGTDPWWFGLGAGAIVALCWHLNRQIGSVLGVVGVGLLLFAVGGAANNLVSGNHAMFNGMAAGVLLGIWGGAILRWKKLRPLIVQIARIERVTWLSKLLGDATADR